MRFVKRFAALGAVAVLGALLVAGCGGGDPSQEDQDATAIRQLLAEERGALHEGYESAQGLKRTEGRLESCVVIHRRPCKWLSELLHYWGEHIDHAAKHLERLHGELNGYPHAAVVAAVKSE